MYIKTASEDREPGPEGAVLLVLIGIGQGCAVHEAADMACCSSDLPSMKKSVLTGPELPNGSDIRSYGRMGRKPPQGQQEELVKGLTALSGFRILKPNL
ncbi:hypothetical protein [Paenibacillus mendelii]|uniref:Uncharacterized protein n=1 Tax=Paenibacillus mendelii TaxID=206163 RepID=A0ABV6JKH4_9BACL|nr:hypothetical protein [Paenibacillus mendelii]MCQ6563077.1 hypothetical protein [Paenibacillus mendelii]